MLKNTEIDVFRYQQLELINNNIKLDYKRKVFLVEKGWGAVPGFGMYYENRFVDITRDY